MRVRVALPGPTELISFEAERGETDGDLHSNQAIIACGREQSGVCRVPGDCVDTPSNVTLQSFYQSPIFFVPNINSRVFGTVSEET